MSAGTKKKARGWYALAWCGRWAVATVGFPGVTVGKGLAQVYEFMATMERERERYKWDMKITLVTRTEILRGDGGVMAEIEIEVPEGFYDMTTAIRQLMRDAGHVRGVEQR